MSSSATRLPRPVATFIGSRIADLRVRRDWTRNRLARELGISFNTLKKLEAGDTVPSLGTLLALVEAFELCSVDELLGGPLGTRMVRNLSASDPIDAPHR